MKTCIKKDTILETDPFNTYWPYKQSRVYRFFYSNVFQRSNVFKECFFPECFEFEALQLAFASILISANRIEFRMTDC